MLIVSPKTYREILEHIDNNKKIAAIKALRSETKSSLRDAKNAIENLSHEHNPNSYPHRPAQEARIRIVPGPVINSIKVDYGTGVFEVDLEEMQLRALMDMQTIGLDVVHNMLHVVKILEALSSGKKVEIVDEEG